MSDSNESSEREADERLLKVLALEKERPLLPMELVWKGRFLLLGTGEHGDLPDALAAFQAALAIDDGFEPALLESGWYFHAVLDDAEKGLPYFERALASSLANLKEAIQGKKGCLEELRSDAAAAEFVRGLVSSALREEDFSEDAQGLQDWEDPAEAPGSK